MNIDSIHFKGHLCFQKEWAGFDTIKPINVIIGRNNSGKSHLLDLVEALCDGTVNSRGWQYRCRSVLDEESLRSVFLENYSGGELGGNTWGNHWSDHGRHFVDIPIIWEVDANGNISNEVFSDDFNLNSPYGESETLEFKRTTGTRREAARTVCAMLNQRGGQVLFGVTSEGNVIGQQVSERTIEGLSAELQRIDPPAFPTVERVLTAGNREVLVVRVSQGTARPYAYRGTTYRRVGNTTVAMSADEYNQMLFERMHSEQRWENQPATGWTLDDLDVGEIRRTVAEAVQRGRLEETLSRDPADLLRGLGLLRDGVLFRAAAVLFGKAERIEFDMPQCLLRVARFRGLDKMEFLDNRQFNGNAFALLASAERFLRDTLPIAGRFEPGRFERIDEPLYPPLATREALANALCHRDYSIGGGSVGVAIYDDRLEVTSSGSLHFGLTPEKLFAPHESRPWNPLIAGTFYRRGVIERWGSGTLKIAEQVSAAGLPHPEIEDDGGCVTVRFRHGQFVPQQQTESIKRQETILALLERAAGGLALREIQIALGPAVSQRQVRRVLEGLKNSGLVESTGPGPSARWKRTESD